MTPELMEAGTRIREEADKRKASSAGLSGGRAASYSRVVVPGELDVAHGAILYLDDITVSFDGFKALNALSLNISAGELRCIIGPNGAGKTTMMDSDSAFNALKPSKLTVMSSRYRMAPCATSSCPGCTMRQIGRAHV